MLPEIIFGLNRLPLVSLLLQTPNADDEEFNLFLFAILIIGVIAVLLCLAVGIILTILALLTIFGLIAMGALSASIIVGIAQKSVAKGFRTFVVVFSTFGSAALGTLTFWFLNNVLKWWTEFKAICLGFGIGLVSGFITGIAIAFVIRKLTPILKNKIGNLKSNKAVTERS
ncbi:hypothetical protein HUK80_14445 [Flavobacterium sp. MAH-1]|uniref:Uncharacterized protein n=1 Tax=Flavobacterium agri TaxID=2743471 RepID=A0A7Y9C785_9FLAO|nr:hypothetical protein [Flavobacterium agri]NUY82100.1 hypothetical protein [Flavobacterium agri]NYA72124.1 hypothetical protein [Flavobacterium agri]